MGTALITGIGGFTGRYLAEELVHRGYSVAGIGIRPRPENVPLDAYGQVDLLDVDATVSFVSEIHPDMVFHLAGIMCRVPRTLFTELTLLRDAI